jgi:hypothetical protein
MFREMLANVYKDYYAYTRSEQPSLVCIINTFNDDHVTRMSIATLSTQENTVPEGWLVLLEIFQNDQTGGSQSKATPCFGFVEKSAVKVRSAKDEVIAKLISEEACPSPNLTHVWEARVALMKVTGKLVLEKPFRMRRVAIVVPSSRLFRAVEVATAMPLFNSLLAPKDLCDSAAEMFNNNREDVLVPVIRAAGKMNASQAEAVRVVARMCTTNLQKPRVALVHGPPGTGKTTGGKRLQKSLNHLNVPTVEMTWVLDFNP